VLNDVTVLSFTHFLQGPSASGILGDLGADVIRIERPGGNLERKWAPANTFLNGESLLFLITGRNTRSVELDITSEEGRNAVWRIIDRADVVVENFRPGVMDRLGYGYDAVRARKPGIVYASLTGFGGDGPHRQRPGQDLLLQAFTGFMQQTGRSDAPPTPVGSSVIDQHSAVWAALSIVTAVYRQRRTGEGTRVEGNLMAAALDLQIEPFTVHLNGGQLFDRSRSGIATRFHGAPYGVFATADGWLCVSMSDTKVLGPMFGDDTITTWPEGDEWRRRDDLNDRIAEHFRRGTTDHWIATLTEHDVWHQLINDYAEVEQDPQIAFNQVITEYEHPKAGTVRALAHPVTYDGTHPPIRRVPPMIGEHTVEILTEAGLTHEEIAAVQQRTAAKRGAL
jgi:crotonobetainyl-CoA:carnitine CoA-transferase CaiB-like acyl-CoA transferase